jgi:hypothetical protein
MRSTDDDRSGCGRLLEDGATLIAVRDALVDCFAANHGEGFMSARAALGLECTDAALRASVEGMVRLAFQQVGGNFDHPTAETVARAVTLLAERSLGWGISEDAVFEHHCLMTRAIGKIAVMNH